MSKQKVANIIIEDYVFVTIAGITPSDTSHFVNEYAIHTKSYFFSPDFKLGRWDGKFRFFTPGNRTYASLIIEIADDLKKLGYKIKVRNKRPKFDLEIPAVDKDYFKEYGWELASHQLKAINSVLETHDGIIRVGTGGGKTLITAVLAELYRSHGYRMIIIVPNKDLIKQTRAELKETGIETGAFYGDEKSIERDVVVSTWQSLARNKKILSLFDGFMVDECHGSQANDLFNLLSTVGKNLPIRIGLTGSLPDHDCDLLKVFSVIGPVRATVKSHYLIKSGWLSELNLLMVRFMDDFHEEWEHYKEEIAEEESEKNISYTEFKNKKLFPEYQNEKTYLKKNTDRLEHVAALVNRLTKEYGNSFILVNTIEFGKKLTKLLGENAIFVSSDIKDRSPIYEAFKTENGIKAVATYSLASTGLNIPRIFNLFLVDGGKSSIKVVQSIGRGLRKAEDKDTVNLIDVHSDTKFSMKHARSRKKIYKTEKYDFREIKIPIEDVNDTVQKCLKNVKSFYDERNKENLREETLES